MHLLKNLGKKLYIIYIGIYIFAIFAYFQLPLEYLSEIIGFTFIGILTMVQFIIIMYLYIRIRDGKSKMKLPTKPVIAGMLVFVYFGIISLIRKGVNILLLDMYKFGKNELIIIFHIMYILFAIMIYITLLYGIKKR